MTSSIGNVASVAARAGGTVVRQVRSVIDPSAARPAGAGQPASGWLAVTVFREPADIDAAALPAPLAEYVDRIEVRVRPAAGGKGTELSARLRDLIASGKAEPSFIVSHELPLDQAPEAYEHFDNRDEGWTKVVLHPTHAGA